MHGVSGPAGSSGIVRDGAADRLVYGLIAYLLPILLLGLSIWALASWTSQDARPPDNTLVFRSVADQAGRWTPQQAAEELAGAPAQLQRSTHRAAHPFWIRVDRHAMPADTGWLEFPSRHTTRMSCWSNGQSLGEIDRDRASGSWRPVRAGFALALTPAGLQDGLLCRAEFLGPAHISVAARSQDELHALVERYNREAGWLDGGLIVLGLFLFITGLINRNGTYVLFASWMLLNLRMAALSAGTDFQWLGQHVPGAWLGQMRLLTVTLYFISTYALFRNFFRDELRHLGSLWTLRLVAWSCPPLLLLSLLLPFGQFLPVIWLATAGGVLLVTAYLLRILWLTRSQVALWYAGSLAITLFASLSEVVAAWLGVRGLTEVVNSVTAALFSGLLASLAVAAQMKQERDDRRQAQRRLQSTYEAVPVGLFSADQQGRFIQANPALRRMLGQSEGDLLPPWSTHFPSGSWQSLMERLRDEPSAELEFVGPAGHRFAVRATLAGRQVEGLIQDVTEQSRLNEDLRFMALNDPLTRVLNRRGVEQALAGLQRELPAGRRLPMAYLDLDRFKLLNDLYGHAAGDEVLQQVCERIGELLSGDMRLGRVGGDEFVILLPGMSLELACLIARGVLTAIGNRPYQIGDRAFQVRGSMGLVEVGADTAFKDAMASADRACREAKSHQTDGLVVFEHDAQDLEELAAEMQLIERLAAGGDVEGLFLMMQPIMSLRKPTGALNFEVLLRMRGDDDKLVPTPRLITAGEHSGRMSMIDRWVLRQTLNWLQAHHRELTQTQFVCMNLSGASLNDERFIEDVYDLLESHREVAPLLCLEITESVALHDLSNTQRFIQQLRLYGTKVALDDFGAGYTSFSYLKDLPGDLLKIDGSFIVNMNEHPANVAIVEAIVSLSRNLGMKTVAEWAEDAATVETLAEIGVDYVQGYAVARPQMPEDLLHKHSSADFVRDAETLALVERLQFQGTLPDLFVGGSPRAAAA
jgi:diguanylate cyclase (GGDEF)-like protein/PAS domain S-box-containing protein